MTEIKFTTSAMNRSSCSKTSSCSITSTSRVVQVVCVFVLLLIMAVLLWFDDSRIDNLEYIWTTPTPNRIISWPSFSLLSDDTKHLNNRYHVFQHVCLESTGSRRWNIFSSKKSSDDEFIEFRNQIGSGDFVFENFTVGEYDTLYDNGRHFQMQKGTYLIFSNTHANNYHAINDFLLPVFNVYHKTELTGLLMPEGCVHCWERRLPIQDLGMKMMNLTVLYPMEELISNMTPSMCFDRLLLERGHDWGPYHMRENRFSEYWSADVFTNFRNSMNGYVRNRLQLQENVEYHSKNVASYTTGTNITGQNISSNPKINEANTVRTKPVLTWMSRGSNEKCFGRCVKNEQDVAVQLSKYFHVNILDFNTNLTTMEALAYIQTTDVFIGLHGAGLAYTAFLPYKAMLVELRGEYSTRMFINMASAVNIPYYAISIKGCSGPGDNEVYMISPNNSDDMAQEIHLAYVHERQKLSDDGPSMTDGRCEFPQVVEPCGHLSSMSNSRCYLQQLDNFPQTLWFQCAWHEAC